MKKKLFVVILIILLDQVVKYLIFNAMNVGESIKVIDNFFYITLHLNNGAAWGIFAGNQILLKVISLILVIVIIIYLIRNKNLDNITTIGLLLYVAGAIGNLIDRFRMNAVIDYFDFTIPIIKYDFPIFNVADMSLVVGCIIILLSILKENKYER
ncbi:MAG: signal peptidase II [Bacilli bacterium]